MDTTTTPPSSPSSPISPSHPPSPPPLRLAIIGGGIGGLSLLLGLLRHTSPTLLQPHIYEAAPRFAEIGAGVAFGSNSVAAMALVDPRLAQAYQRHATFHSDAGARARKVWSGYRMGMDGRGVRGHGQDGGSGSGNRLEAGAFIHEVRTGTERSSVHRARFLDAMAELVAEESVSFGKRLLEIWEREEGGELELRFEDGSVAAVDAVVGCDGVKSRVRQIVLAGEPEIEPVFTGKYAYRGLIPMDEAVEALGEETAKNAWFHWGYDGHVLTFPIEHGKTMNVVAFRTKRDGKWDHGNQWVLPGNKEQMVSDYDGWGKDVQSILRMMRNPDIWALFDHLAAKSYYKGKVCLLGDAAHASTPHQGAGAGMAIEDAFVLSRLLARARKRKDIEKVFHAYDAVRRPRTQKLVSTSRDAGCLYEFQKKGVGDNLEALKEDLDGRMRWVWDADLEEHLQQAFKVYEG
ncbi:MAG: hypothetical protein M1821_003998 [Bathelium mastoideum]|nr:MAG: hypothetical protein M1821_003998 [Bathelium mastoideum]